MSGLLVLILIFAGFGVYGARSERAGARGAENGPPAARELRRVQLRRLVDRLARSSGRERLGRYEVRARDRR